MLQKYLQTIEKKNLVLTCFFFVWFLVFACCAAFVIWWNDPTEKPSVTVPSGCLCEQSHQSICVVCRETAKGGTQLKKKSIWSRRKGLEEIRDSSTAHIAQNPLMCTESWDTLCFFHAWQAISIFQKPTGFLDSVLLMQRQVRRGCTWTRQLPWGTLYGHVHRTIKRVNMSSADYSIFRLTIFKFVFRRPLKQQSQPAVGTKQFGQS